MAQEVQRVRYFTGEFLQEADFNGEQAYHIRMRYLHNRWLHTQGIATGFTVTAGPGALQLTISPGVAVAQVTETRIPEFVGEDVAKELVTITPTVLTLAGPGGSQIYIVASFAEVQAVPTPSGNTRWAERPDIRPLAPGAPTPDNTTTLILARVTLNGAGSGIATIDLSERRSVGVRGELEATQIRLPVTGVPNPALWPRLSGGAANRLDISGTVNLSAGSNITLAAGATVDGRDVSTDGATLDTHVTNMTLHVTNGNAHDHTGGDGAPIPFSAITAVPDILVKAYVVALSSPINVLRSFGLASAVRNSPGNFTVTWTTPIAGAPVILISLLVNAAAQTFFYHIQTVSPTSVNFTVTDAGGALIDPPRFMVVII
jgi:hypothetical protein